MNGLRKLRKNQDDKKPKHGCDNCKCTRYSSCGCMKSNGDNRKTRNANKQKA